jgi:ABC-type nitrate/sulfonate/bicarbonate transport system permease component
MSEKETAQTSSPEESQNLVEQSAVTKPPKPRRENRALVAFRSFGLPVLILIVLVTAWEGVSRGGLIADYLLPAPSAVFRRLVTDWPLFWQNASTTLLEVIIGFAIGVIIAVLIGTGIAMVPLLRRAIYPLVVASQSLPVLVLAPLLILWFGYGLLPKIIIVVQVVFFPVAVGVISGLTAVSEEVLLFGRSLGASWWRLFWKVRVPASLPYVFSGLKIGASYSAIAAVISEWSGAQSGLGALMLRANNVLDTELVFGSLVLITVIGVGFFGLVSLLERRVIPWHASHRRNS